MFRPMRRNRQLLAETEVKTILSRCSHGILACQGDDGYPYAVPLNYVYVDDRIYFHAAASGHKIDAIQRQPKVSFAIVDEDRIVSAEYTSYFRSVIAFGRARITEGDEKLQAFRALMEKYSSDQPEVAKQQELAKCDRAVIVAIDIEYLTGKQAKELVKDEE